MGVEKEIISPGDGATYPKCGQMVVIHYIACLVDGSVIDSSRSRGNPFKFRIGKGEVIKDGDCGDDDVHYDGDIDRFDEDDDDDVHMMVRYDEDDDDDVHMMVTLIVMMKMVIVVMVMFIMMVTLIVMIKLVNVAMLTERNDNGDVIMIE
ncbi:peptidylprolyl isomerase [Elysia marginata]|uniref:peptidylprolyl isomerase n=1 Tax=Elysia marginata TaxID=1093978 RepID=A0AAV4J4B5_9GAST|nr:peptidylprolyl isomerase [Elysia marginata]